MKRIAMLSVLLLGACAPDDPGSNAPSVSTDAIAPPDASVAAVPDPAASTTGVPTTLAETSTSTASAPASTRVETTTTIVAASTPDVDQAPNDLPLAVVAPGCPTITFDALPAGFGSSIEDGLGDGSGLPGLHLATPNGRTVIAPGGWVFGATAGTAITVDGYRALRNTVDGGESISIYSFSDVCERIDLTYFGTDAAELDVLSESIDVDSSVLVDVSAGIAGSTLFGVAGRLDADRYLDVVGDDLGEPDFDSGWLPMPDELVCTGSVEYREIFHNDVRVVFERSDQDERIEAWSIGEPVDLIAPAPMFTPTEASGVATSDGVEVGADRSILDQYPNVDKEGPIGAIPGARAVLVAFDGDTIVGFGAGRNDCL